MGGKVIYPWLQHVALESKEDSKNHYDCSFGVYPTIVSYNATSSVVRFENKNNFTYIEKSTRLLQRWQCCKFRSRRTSSWSLRQSMYLSELLESQKMFEGQLSPEGEQSA
jgi:hypothetical protein